jgi:intracellular sulfur oxidation DsrE/DsrF family protein
VSRHEVTTNPDKHRRSYGETQMLRRTLLQLACATVPIAPFVEPARAATTDGAKVVYHLADLDKVGFVLGNIGNHYDGMGGPENVTIALVVHGPALKAFRAADAAPDVTQQTAARAKSGLQLNACIHSMQALNITLDDLLPGFTVADKGAVVRLAELQGQGYAYLRP